MPHSCVLDTVIVILLFCADVLLSELQYMPQRHRQHVFSSGVNYDELLVWAVKLDLSFLDDEDASSAADVVAADTGLHNQGQIGNLDRYYVFSHPAETSIRQASVSSLLSVFQNHSQTLSDDKRLWIKDNVHQLLDIHPFVEWYMLQRVVPRFQRRAASAQHSRTEFKVNFNDPLYHKQWHLVSHGFCELLFCIFLLHYFE